MSKVMDVPVSRYSWLRLWLPMVLLVVGIIGALPIGDYLSSRTVEGLGAVGKETMARSVGVVDLKVLEMAHPSFTQLQALEEQMVIYQEQWYDHIQLLARQASLDGLKSPFLTEMSKAIEPAVSMQSKDMENLWEEARKERLDYQTKLQQEIEADLEKQQINIEKKLAKQVEELERETKQAILNRQVELALRKLTPQEAEALLDEISTIAAKSQEKKERLETEANRQLQAKVDEAKQTATGKLDSYDEALKAKLTTQIDKLQSGEDGSTSPPNGGSQEQNYPEAIWQQQLASGYLLDTSSADALEARLRRDETQLETKMEPLRARYRQVQEEMEGDLQSHIAKVAKSMGLSLVLDKNKAEVKGIDITNQVLVILQGEA